ncbi:MAG: peptidoglycan-binding domain-containing protein [Minisyncoccota bacterium]
MHFFKNPRFISVAVGTAFAVSLLGGAPLAQAASLSTVQIQAILNLLQAFGADTATIANVQAALENTPTSTQSTPTSTSNGSTSTTGGSTPSNSGNCALLSTNLTLGSTDRTTEGEVSRLQAFLGKDRSIYPEDAVTGYFGSSTLAAVQRWQAAQGIVSSGSSESTGYGNVGPLTREDMNKEMEKECEMGDSSSSSSLDSSSSESTASSTVGDVSGGENAKVGVGAHCGGFIVNAPQCAEGLHCQLGSIVDQGGTCVQNSEGVSGPTATTTPFPSSGDH